MTLDREQRLKAAIASGDHWAAINEILGSLREFGHQPLMNAKILSRVEGIENLLEFLHKRASFDPAVPVMAVKRAERQPNADDDDGKPIYIGDAGSWDRAREIACDHFQVDADCAELDVYLNIEDVADPVFYAAYAEVYTKTLDM